MKKFAKHDDPNDPNYATDAKAKFVDTVVAPYIEIILPEEWELYRGLLDVAVSDYNTFRNNAIAYFSGSTKWDSLTIVSKRSLLVHRIWKSDATTTELNAIDNLATRDSHLGLLVNRLNGCHCNFIKGIDGLYRNMIPDKLGRFTATELNPSVSADVYDAPYTGETTRTINLDDSMTVTEIQELINDVGRNIPAGVVITLQFANGDYTLTSPLYFNGFYGGGQILVQGNTSETDANILHTTQDVVLDFTTSVGFSIDGNKVKLLFQNLRIEVITALQCMFFSSTGGGDNRVQYCYCLVGGTTGNGAGVFTQRGSVVQIVKTYFTGGLGAIWGLVNSQIYSSGNDDTGTLPLYGLRSDGNTVLGKDGTQPSGSTANEYTNRGGQIN